MYLIIATPSKDVAGVLWNKKPKNYKQIEAANKSPDLKRMTLTP